MMKIAAMMSIAMMQTSCAWIGPREAVRQPALIMIPETYTKAEVDAVNAEIQCRSLARTPLQAQRCGIRR
jgi:hypothetical protein